MWNDPYVWLHLALIVWLGAIALGVIGVGPVAARCLLALGCVCGIGAVIASRLHSLTPVCSAVNVGGAPVCFALDGAASWLLGFGLAAASIACLLFTTRSHGWRGWVVGAACCLIGALGVFGLTDSIAFLVAWELMSLGGAVLLLSERGDARAGNGVLFMLALLEVGSVALMAAFIVLGQSAGSTQFAAFAAGAARLPAPGQWFIGLLLLVGFGAKLGVLPFYEWLPAAYGVGSGASGALLSGVVLNAAFYALGHGIAAWLAPTPAAFGIGVLLVVAGVGSAILAILFAFQEEDWRRLLSLSSAENACIAVTALGASLLFASGGQADLAGLAWLVALLHLAGHPLAKGALLLAGDGVCRATGSYQLTQRGVLRRAAWPLGVGSVLAGMSLAAMPPVIGFVTEWYVFQTVFQGFHLSSLSARLILALAGAGLAITAAVALATFVKLLGLGLAGTAETGPRVPLGHALGVGALGAATLVLAVVLPWLSPALRDAAAMFSPPAAEKLHAGWLMVPLTANFAFISPSKLVIVGPLLALVPFGLLLAARAFRTRTAPVWFGGLPRAGERVATTALTFSNALRTFYSFIYRPRLEVQQEHHGDVQYFVKRLSFTPAVAPVFGPLLFAPITRWVGRLARWLRPLQAGQLHVYLALPGLALVVILILAVLI